jgi:hypothetical protein
MNSDLGDCVIIFGVRFGEVYRNSGGVWREHRNVRRSGSSIGELAGRKKIFSCSEWFWTSWEWSVWAANRTSLYTCKGVLRRNIFRSDIW